MVSGKYTNRGRAERSWVTLLRVRAVELRKKEKRISSLHSVTEN